VRWLNYFYTTLFKMNFINAEKHITYINTVRMYPTGKLNVLI